MGDSGWALLICRCRGICELADLKYMGTRETDRRKNWCEGADRHGLGGGKRG